MRVSLVSLSSHGCGRGGRGGRLAACLVLAAMSVQMAPPPLAAYSAASSTTATTPDQAPGPSAASLSAKTAPTEVPSLRTAESVTYANYDGSFTRQNIRRPHQL